MQALFIETSPLVFIILSVIIGGGAAFLAGRGLALTWQPLWKVVAYMILMGFALRFLHFALFEGKLLSVHYYLTDTLVLLAAAWLGYRLTRVKQMITQYNWLYRRSGLFSWREKSGKAS